MIINPDQVRDKNVGAGKLLTRVVTSILLLLLFQPTGFLLDRNPEDLGLLHRLQSAIIGTENEAGVIDRLFSGNVNVSYSGTKGNEDLFSDIYENNLFLKMYMQHQQEVKHVTFIIL